MKRGANSWMFLVGLALVLLCEMRLVHGVNLSPGQCKEERRLAINSCKAVGFGQAPSPACCVRVRVSHWECACPEVDPKLVALFPLDRVIKTLKTCGRTVPRHFKCGSLTFP